MEQGTVCLAEQTCELRFHSSALSAAELWSRAASELVQHRDSEMGVRKTTRCRRPFAELDLLAGAELLNFAPTDRANACRRRVSRRPAGGGKRASLDITSRT